MPVLEQSCFCMSFQISNDYRDLVYQLQSLENIYFDIDSLDLTQIFEGAGM